LTDYHFQENKYTETLDYAYELWLFHHPSHLSIQHADWITFTAFNRKHRKVDAHVHVGLKNNEGYSPIRAPFGSFQFSDGIKPKILYSFITFVCERLKEKGVSSLELKNPADGFNPCGAPLLNSFLLHHGFSIVRSEVQSVLKSDHDFYSGLNAWEKRRLRQSEQAGLNFRRLDSGHLKEVYQFILACRTERDYVLSIDWDTLKKTVDTFPDRFVLFGVLNNDEFAAASISINVGNKILSNFHSAHPRKFDQLSPVVMLLNGIFNYCCVNGFQVLDLGTSALEGTPNFKLLDFKLGLGAQPSMKLTFKKFL
jgi:hypothetical protein